MALNKNNFISMNELLKPENRQMSVEEILQEKRTAYIKNINDGIINAWKHKEKFYHIEVKSELYNPDRLTTELTALGFKVDYIWQCGSINVYFN